MFFFCCVHLLASLASLCLWRSWNVLLVYGAPRRVSREKMLVVCVLCCICETRTPLCAARVWSLRPSSQNSSPMPPPSLLPRCRHRLYFLVPASAALLSFFWPAAMLGLNSALAVAFLHPRTQGHQGMKAADQGAVAAAQTSLVSVVQFICSRTSPLSLPWLPSVPETDKRRMLRPSSTSVRAVSRSVSGRRTGAAAGDI